MALLRAVILFIAGLGAISTANVTRAGADCISDCLAGKDCSLNYSGACSSAVSDCSIACSGSQGPAFGAIAYDSASEAFGYAYQLPDEDAAAAFALKKRAQQGDACKVIVTFSDRCAALASGKKGDAPFTSTVIADSEDAAKSQALANCAADGGAGCEIEVWSCSFR